MVRKLLLLFGVLAAFTLQACEKKQAASVQASTQPSNAELEGEWLYDNNCAECHESPQPDLHKQPPNLHGLFRRGSLPSGAPATAAQIRTTIIEGRGTMPAFDQRLREEDVDNLVRYLRKLN
ncbi:MAG: cytochrome c [Terriglobales bacterium]